MYLFGFPIMLQGSVTFPVWLVARTLLGREDYFFTVWYHYSQDQAVSRCCQTLAKLVWLLHFPLPFILEHHLFCKVFRSLGNLGEVKTSKIQTNKKNLSHLKLIYYCMTFTVCLDTDVQSRTSYCLNPTWLKFLCSSVCGLNSSLWLQIWKKK